MNGQPIPHERGGPVRALVPGWYATDSVKWLRRIWFTDREFDGFFQAQDYRFRTPDERGPGQRMTELPVHAMITMAGTDARAASDDLSIRGVAWGGTGGIADVLVRVDDGPWARAHLGPIRGSYARVSWEAQCPVSPGVHIIACRAIDGMGRSQPDRPLANVQGYGNNAVHRVTITAGR
jgi:DMSO/TMAO reductase YedYZ molybdopterin-dependent catalytic subunit